jgi:two-component system LytT family sensor kinase
MSKQRMYWYCQLGGWFVFVLMNLLFYGLKNTISPGDLFTYFTWFLSGILITHLFRFVVIKLHWLKLTTFIQIPLVLVSSVACAILFHLFQYLSDGIINAMQFPEINLTGLMENVVNFAYVFFFWSVIYFSYHFLMNFRKAEIQSLRWQANIKEIELSTLKSQLNPHFMFNAMNSIRALIDENPGKAKEAVTQLSNILRNTLMMEKNKVISFDEEIRIVTDYLNLEKIRFEERLNYSISVSPEASAFSVPPLLLQTLIENGIKHGISKLTEGGLITLSAELKSEKLTITIRNSGHFDENKKSETGFGLKNTRDRLIYVFGEAAAIEIRNEDDNLVRTEIVIPKYSLN